jgi:hypothetical protein
MAIGLEDLQVLKAAEAIADSIWKRVGGWDNFAKDTVGKQITRAADSMEQISRSLSDDITSEKNFNFYITRAEVCSRRNTGLIERKNAA